MYEEIRNKEVKTRAGHFCEWCGNFIPKGSYVRHRVYKFNGDFNTGWLHDDCYRAMEEVGHEYPDGWIPGDFSRGSTEYIG